MPKQSQKKVKSPHNIDDNLRKAFNNLSPQEKKQCLQLAPQSRDTYLRSKLKKKNQIIIEKKTTTDDVPLISYYFYDLISDSFLIIPFVFHIEKLFCDENLYAFKYISGFQYNSRTMSRNEILSSLEEFINTFLKSDCEKEINISDILKSSIVNIYKAQKDKENPEISLKIFKHTQDELAKLMIQGPFKSYYLTSEYNIRKSQKNEILKREANHYTPDYDITNEEWDVIMTGSSEVVYEKGDYILSEGIINSNFYKLENGSISVIKKKNDKDICLAILSKSGIFFGEISIFGNIATTCSIVANSTVVVRKIPAKIILQLLFSTSDGPKLGRKLFTFLGRKLACQLLELTKFESISTEAYKPILRYIKEKKGDYKQDIKEIDYTSPNVILHQRFTQLNENESVVFDSLCLYKGKWRCNFYITSKHICLYYSKITKKKKILYPFSDILSVISPSKNDLIIELSNNNNLDLKFDKNKYCEKNYLILSNISKYIDKNEQISNDFSEFTDFDDSQTTCSEYDDNNVNSLDLLGELSEKEWLKLSGIKNLHLESQNNKNYKEINYNAIYFPGEIILQEGISYYHKIYRIISGSCNVYKNIPFRNDNELSKFHICTLKENDIFGSITYFIDTRASTSIIANDIVKLQVIDSYYVKELYSKHKESVLKFFFTICNNLANIINIREKQGFSRYSEKSQQDNDNTNDNTNDNNIITLQKSKLLNNPKIGIFKLLNYNGTNKSIIVHGSLQSSFFKIIDSNTSEIILTLDLLLYTIKATLYEFSLLKEREIYTFEPLNDSIESWTFRIGQYTISIINRFLENASEEFFKEALQANKVINAAEIDIQYNSFKFIPGIALLKMEFIFIFLEKSKVPITKLNYVFGSIECEGDTKLIITSCYETVTLLYESGKQRDDWLKSIMRIKQSLYFAGIATFHGNRLDKKNEIKNDILRKQTLKQQQSKIITINDLQEIIQLMKNNTSGIELKKRRILLKQYPNTFSGYDAVTWLLNTLNLKTRKEAIKLGKKLLENDFFYHITHDKGFEDKKKLYYRFKE